jgi:hypothetical protein
VGKAYGFPIQAFSGQDRFGIGHAWVGFLAMRGNMVSLDYFGRYRDYNYYIGDYRNPQTGLTETDRELELRFAALGKSCLDVRRTGALMRVARELYPSDPDAALELAKKTVTVNPYMGDGWRFLAQAVADGKISPSERQKYFDALMKSCGTFPDLIFDVFQKFLGPWDEKTWKNRMEIYDRAFALFVRRPDLQIMLREQQGDELVAAGKKDFALVVYGKTAQDLSKEGFRMTGLAHKAEAIFREQHRLQDAITFYETVIRFVPRIMLRRISPAYLDLAQALIRLCDETGDVDGADKWRRFIDSAPHW